MIGFLIVNQDQINWCVAGVFIWYDNKKDFESYYPTTRAKGLRSMYEIAIFSVFRDKSRYSFKI